jgi:hypothetical protein
MDLPPGTNSPTAIKGISNSGHAIDELQSEGFVPSVGWLSPVEYIEAWLADQGSLSALTEG